MTVSDTRRAERDLIEVGLSTVATWGDAQWEDYAALLEHTCEVIIPKNRRFARKFPLRPGLFRWKCERHVVFFCSRHGSSDAVVSPRSDAREGHAKPLVLYFFPQVFTPR